LGLPVNPVDVPNVVRSVSVVIFSLLAAASMHNSASECSLTHSARRVRYK
jgi:hypothetical protein